MPLFVASYVTTDYFGIKTVADEPSELREKVHGCNESGSQGSGYTQVPSALKALAVPGMSSRDSLSVEYGCVGCCDGM